MKIETLTVGQMAEHCYLFIDEGTKECIIIDPGDDADYICTVITRLAVTPVSIIATHGHFDHIMAACALQLMYAIPFFMHPSDRFLLLNMQSSAKHFLGLKDVDPPPVVARSIENGDTISVGKSLLTVVYAPGHTPGSICLWDKKQKILFVGDTIFEGGGVGRTDFSYSEPLKLSESIAHILSLDAGTILLPGHGEETTVYKEKMYRVQSKNI